MTSQSNVDQVRSDFDAIAALSGDSGTDRYDSFIAAQVPSNAVDVLDVGCGTGRLSIAIAATGPRVLGVDLSPNMIAMARANAAGMQHVTFICTDFLEHDFASHQFDCIVSSAMLHHVAAAVAIPRMVDLLRPGGRLIINDLRADSGLLDYFRAAIAFAHFTTLRLLHTRRVRARRDLRDAWNRHGAGERYLTLAEARQLAERLLPGAKVFNHWLWRYTIVWQKP